MTGVWDSCFWDYSHETESHRWTGKTSELNKVTLFCDGKEVDQFKDWPTAMIFILDEESSNEKDAI